MALCLLAFSVSFISDAWAQPEDETNTLYMFYGEKDLVVTPTRNPKLISHVAENMTVITAADIEEMNAHTLADVLFNITGVQVDSRGGPGSADTARIQGSEFRHAIVIIDDVTLNNLSDSFADIAAVPAQIIDRIEIIKGPASSAWGSSLGGIIHIITKGGDGSRKAGGMLSASYGERNTGDYRAEVSGKVESLSYYLYGGNLVSNGLRPNTSFYSNNIYSKLKWDVSSKANVAFTFGYNQGTRGEGQYPAVDLSFGNAFEYLFSTLSFNYSLTDTADLNASLRTSRQRAEHINNSLSTGEILSASNYDDKNNGGSLKFTWKNSIHDVVSGFDYDYGELESNNITGGKQSLGKWAVFVNDTMTAAKFAFTPGIRYDHTSTNGSFVSPSLGVTYNLGEKTMLRAIGARGFSTPPLSATFGTGTFSVPNPDLHMEKVWSVQAGIESTVLKYLWLKGTAFRHEITDALFNETLSDGTFTAVNQGKQRRQGFEFELKTVPVYNVSISAGVAFTDATDRDTGEELLDVPRYTYDVGIHYNDNKSLRALLKGHYIWWNADSALNAQYNSIIWDFSLTKKVLSFGKRNAELFFTAHNIFNGSQYLVDAFKNPRRWVEAGLRLKI
ncbi:MAG: TonB-dependent receptor plug domain-containing protein [Thermodesulfovibrionales bacterium]